jgi:hypothetical protein
MLVGVTDPPPDMVVIKEVVEKEIEDMDNSSQ